jgi:hypothetical protein
LLKTKLLTSYFIVVQITPVKIIIFGKTSLYI